MGKGLQRVAKQCGGLIVKSDGEEARYDADGKLVSVRRRTARLPLVVPEEWGLTTYLCTCGNPITYARTPKTERVVADVRCGDCDV